MTREEVYKSIDSEREFQIKLVEDADHPEMVEDFHLGDTISAIEHNLNKAREAWYIGSAPHPIAMKYLRKIAGLCVQIGEKHGMPERVK